MKIGLFVHSNTGNTLSVAEKLRIKLVEGGHKVVLTKLEPVGGENVNEADINKINFERQPDASGYEVVIFCAPVRAFSISPVLASYLSKINSMKDQKVDLFVTQHLPYSFLGGKHAIAQMKSACETKGANIGNTGIVNWKSKKRDIMIEDIVNRFSKL